MAKKCQRCGHENTDSMRFCLNCGATLPDAPTEPVHKTDAPTESFSGTPTFVGAAKRQTENFSDASGSFPPSYPTILTPKPKSKIGLIIGGIAALLFLLVIASAAVVFYNIRSKKISLINNTPTPFFSPASTDQSPTPHISASPNFTPTAVPDPKSSPQASFTPPLDATKTGVFTVYANEGWQLSEINVIRLENFRVSTSGLVDIAGVKTQIPAKGLNDKNSVSRRSYPEYTTGALLFRTHFADGHLGNVLPVSGGNFQNFPDELGRLEFCINDNAPQNNGGQFTVLVTATNVPKAKK